MFRLFVTICGGGKNAADFGITYAAGELNRILPKETAFAIISNDNDFRHLMSHLRTTRPNSYHVKVDNTSTRKNIHNIMSLLGQWIRMNVPCKQRFSDQLVIIQDEEKPPGDKENKYGESSAGLPQEPRNVQHFRCGRMGLSASCRSIQRRLSDSANGSILPPPQQRQNRIACQHSTPARLKHDAKSHTASSSSPILIIDLTDD
jgi:hypothetical protein